jgi:hypothetical protein
LAFVSGPGRPELPASGFSDCFLDNEEEERRMRNVEDVMKSVEDDKEMDQHSRGGGGSYLDGEEGYTGQGDPEFRRDQFM